MKIYGTDKEKKLSEENGKLWNMENQKKRWSWKWKSQMRQ